MQTRGYLQLREALVAQTDRAMRRVSRNLANCCTTVETNTTRGKVLS